MDKKIPHVHNASAKEKCFYQRTRPTCTEPPTWTQPGTFVMNWTVSPFHNSDLRLRSGSQILQLRLSPMTITCKLQINLRVLQSADLPTHKLNMSELVWEEMIRVELRPRQSLNESTFLNMFWGCVCLYLKEAVERWQEVIRKRAEMTCNRDSWRDLNA